MHLCRYIYSNRIMGTRNMKMKKKKKKEQKKPDIKLWKDPRGNMNYSAFDIIIWTSWLALQVF